MTRKKISSWRHYKNLDLRVSNQRYTACIDVTAWCHMLRCHSMRRKTFFITRTFFFWRVMDIYLRLYLDFSCRACAKCSVMWALCKHWKNGRFYIWIRSLLSIYMYLNHFGQQVSLRMFINLLANIFLAEIPSKA